MSSPHLGKFQIMDSDPLWQRTTTSQSWPFGGEAVGRSMRRPVVLPYHANLALPPVKTTLLAAEEEEAALVAAREGMEETVRNLERETGEEMERLTKEESAESLRGLGEYYENIHNTNKKTLNSWPENSTEMTRAQVNEKVVDIRSSKLETRRVSDDIRERGIPKLQEEGKLDAEGKPIHGYPANELGGTKATLATDGIGGHTQPNDMRAGAFREEWRNKLETQKGDEASVSPKDQDNLEKTRDKAETACTSGSNKACMDAFEEHQNARKSAGLKNNETVDEHTRDIVNREDKLGEKGYGRGRMDKYGKLLLAALGGAALTGIGIVVTEALLNKNGGTCKIQQFPNQTTCGTLPNLFPSIVRDGEWTNGECVVTLKKDQRVEAFEEAVNSCQNSTSATYNAADCPDELLWKVTPKDSTNGESNQCVLHPFPKNQSDCTKMANTLSAKSGKWGEACCTLTKGEMSPDGCCNGYCFASCGGAQCDDKQCSGLTKKGDKCGCYTNPPFGQNLVDAVKCIPPISLVSGCASEWLTGAAKTVAIVIGVVLAGLLLLAILWYVIKSVFRAKAARATQLALSSQLPVVAASVSASALPAREEFVHTADRAARELGQLFQRALRT
jgi:hypothetical protein